ncbi:hypothetical protein ABIA33_003138 [Streptacidiphilus sp. MAP12-16]
MDSTGGSRATTLTRRLVIDLCRAAVSRCR